MFTLTSLINFLCLALSLWLGFYIVTRSPHSRVSWLASATLWSLSGSFLNTLTYINVSPEQGTLPWWWGWSVALMMSLMSLTLGFPPLAAGLLFLTRCKKSGWLARISQRLKR